MTEIASRNGGDSAAATSKQPGKKVAIEKIYQKKTQLEHILLRPDTYIGSVERVEQEMWVWNFETERMVKKSIKYVPGLFKIFDEILGLNRFYNKKF
jgi:DNA topoisomerase-2